MNLVIWLVVGALMGGVACYLRRTESPGLVVTNVIVGVMGALVGGWLLSPIVGGSTTDQVDFSGVALIVSLTGATLFLAISNLAHREMSR